MRIDVVADLPSGGCSAAVHDARAAALLTALDPDDAFVVIEGHSPGGSGWQVLEVPLTPASVSAHRVRGVRFDLLLNPGEALAAAEALDVPFPHGGLFAWQTATEPPPELRLLALRHEARASAMRGIGVKLLIVQPHATETAVLWSPTESLLDAALSRLRK